MSASLTERSPVPATAGPGRRVLAIASSGGHLKQLASLVTRLASVGSVTWVTYDRGPSRQVLEQVVGPDDRVVFVPYAAPRDVRHLVGDARAVRRLLRHTDYDLAVSTGAGIAVASLPLARAAGVRSCFIESATRATGPSMSGRILARVPGVELYSQNEPYMSRWGYVGSVHDEFVAGLPRAVDRIERVVVTVGTIAPYGFRRLLEQLVRVLPGNAEVLWQTGETDTSGLGIEGRPLVPADELVDAMRKADLVVGHAGTGTALTAFEHGVCPVLVPRRRIHGEHVDDHQVPTARALQARGLATYMEVEDLDAGALLEAARRTVARTARPPALAL